MPAFKIALRERVVPKKSGVPEGSILTFLIFFTTATEVPVLVVFVFIFSFVQQLQNRVLSFS